MTISRHSVRTRWVRRTIFAVLTLAAATLAAPLESFAQG